MNGNVLDDDFIDRSLLLSHGRLFHHVKYIEPIDHLGKRARGSSAGSQRAGGTHTKRFVNRMRVDKSNARWPEEISYIAPGMFSAIGY